MSKVYFAADHAGFEMKKILIAHVQSLGHEVEDFGAFTLDQEDDYPDFITPCATRVASEEGSFGVVLGGSGQGEAMCANRIKGIRAAVLWGAGLTLVALAREHNNANMLSIGARFSTEEDAKRAVEIFLTSPFSADERHVRRLAKF